MIKKEENENQKKEPKEDPKKQRAKVVKLLFKWFTPMKIYKRRETRLLLWNNSFANRVKL
jgi:hypothetical protein